MSTMHHIIKEHRNALGLTQKELAEKLSISDKTVSRWESGNQFPDAILLPDLAEALDISINELYGIKPETNNAVKKEHITVSHSRFSDILDICYKIAMANGLALFLFGSMILIHINTIRVFDSTSGERTYGNVFTYVGLIICVCAQIAYMIIYRAKHLNSLSHTKSEITFGGICALAVLGVLLIVYPVCITVPIGYSYELAISILATTTLVMMFLQQRKINKEKPKVRNIVNIIIFSVVVLCLLIMLAVFIYLNFFEETLHLDKLFEQIGAISNQENFEHHLILYSFYLIAPPLLLSLIFYYIYLTIKSKKLK